MTDTTQKTMSTADIEQSFLKINAKISLSLAGFMAIPLFESMLVDPPNATGVLLGAIAFIFLIYMLVMLARYSKLSKKISKKSYWTMQFKDEYVDYVSGISQRFAFQVLLLGALMLSLLGGEDGNLKELVPFSDMGMLQFWTMLSLIIYGGMILYKFHGESDDE